MLSILAPPPAVSGEEATDLRRIVVRRVLLFLSAMAAPALMLFFIDRYGVNVPFWDEWDELSVVPKAYDGSLDLASLIGQQNEHRPVTSRLVSILLARTSHLNLVYEMYLGFAVEFLALILIWRMLVSGLKDRASFLIGPLTIVSSLLLFWTVAWENWTWGIASFQYLSAVFWAVFTVWAITNWRGQWTGTVIGSASVAIAIYTTGHGFALLPIAILWMLADGMADRNVRWLQLCWFCLVGAGCTILYLRNYHSPAFYSPGVSRVRPLEIVAYLITYIGSPFWTTRWALAPSMGIFGIAGILGGGYYVSRFMRDWMRSAAPWLLLGCYTIVNGVVTALGRIDFGVEQANQPRYRSIVIPLWISLVAILSMIAVHLSPRLAPRVMRAGLATIIILFLGGYSYLYYRGFRYIRFRNQLFSDSLPYVLQYATAPDDKLRALHPYPPTVRALSRKLEQYQLGPFSK